MVIYHKAVTEGYIKDVCFDKTSITKIFSSTTTPWNHIKGYKCSRKIETTAIRP